MRSPTAGEGCHRALLCDTIGGSAEAGAVYKRSQRTPAVSSPRQARLPSEGSRRRRLRRPPPAAPPAPPADGVTVAEPRGGRTTTGACRGATTPAATRI